jgi:hypothetical protein
MKHLLTLGDSFTYGEELADLKKAWPYLLGSLIDYSVINLGLPGVSNDTIIRSLINHVTLEREPRPNLVVIGWTSPGRVEYSDDLGEFSIWPGYTGKRFENDGSKWRYDLVEYMNRYHDTGWFHRRWLHQVLLAQAFLKSQDIPYVMLNTLNNDYYRQIPFDGFMKIREAVDQDRFMCFGESGMIEWVDHTAKGPGGHFLDQGHEIVAKRIYEYTRNISRLP